jgi:hypothetical protein
MCDNDEAKLYPSRFREMGKAHSDADGLKILIMGGTATVCGGRTIIMDSQTEFEGGLYNSTTMSTPCTFLFARVQF